MKAYTTAEQISTIKFHVRDLNEFNFNEISNRIVECINGNSNNYEFDFDVCEYIIETYDNGNKSHAKEFFSELPFSMSRMIAFNLGQNNRDDIYTFITD